MRRFLDLLYDAAAYAAAFFMVGILVMVLASVLGRLLGFNLRGSDAYAGYCMAAASFLALAHTLKRGEHIRVNLFLERSGPRARHALELLSHGVGLLLERFGGRLRRPLEIWSHLAGAFFCAVLALYSVRLAWQSHVFNDISQGNDATPMWIPQIGMAVGAIVLLVAMVDDLVAVIRRQELRTAPADEIKAIE